MPRMSKKRKEEWAFFLNDRRRIAYNALCRRCVHNCKQSFRAMVIVCPHYHLSLIHISKSTTGKRDFRWFRFTSEIPYRILKI